MSNPKFVSGIYGETIANVSRKTVFWDVEFCLPEAMREAMPHNESAKIHGIFLMGFYADPQPGQKIEHSGFAWRIVDIIHFPAIKGSRTVRRMSRVETVLLGALPPSVADE
jgi:hypothetical protein